MSARWQIYAVLICSLSHTHPAYAQTATWAPWHQTGGRPPGLLQTRSFNGVRCVSMRVAVGGTINPFTVGYTDASQEPAVLLNYSGDPVRKEHTLRGPCLCVLDTTVLDTTARSYCYRPAECTHRTHQPTLSLRRIT